MPTIVAGEVTLHYEESGRGAPVVLIPGTGARGRTWWLHQVPALVAAGYRAITLDNRGAGRSGPVGPSLTVADLVADAAALIEEVAGGPCRLVGTSMGSLIIQELLLVRPELASRAVLIASRARPDPMSLALAAAERQLADSGVKLPRAYDAATRALQNLSPRTLADPAVVQDWLDILELSPTTWNDPGLRAQMDAALDTDRRPAYAGIGVPALVLSFADDLVAPPARGRELAAAIPGAVYEEIAGAGHYGYLERPEAVNEAILRFLAA
ncbi:hydrolase [Actinoplanes sp. NBRC 14428]|uniref:Pimeloyl-ACP methyl ester carboxylesterase n=1 Tax=Pseudosporangium ferrugineum TaxID=439699 RepID=A0A2T0RQU6_9ACTN|nr:alpha/beta hydrolase [Pseudosporangium ferrugineum]PRY23463.1 pimeloyl-ACP methyl ester carboxylesterase [Pseudosporangium ferrugineum]BCJ55466.1 hydrolase [Actinoplanes sp. NBRC 14428]